MNRWLIRIGFWLRHPTWFPLDPTGEWEASSIFNRKIARLADGEVLMVPQGNFCVRGQFVPEVQRILGSRKPVQIASR